MPPRHRLLAALVAVTWGLNFPAIHLSLEQFPPFFLVALRWALVAVPTLLLVPRPRVAWRWIIGYGLGFGVLQFAFLYLAMENGMPAGLASLVLQSSAPFTVLLAAVLLRERLTGRQGLGVAVAVTGLAGIAVHRAGLDGGAALLPVVLTLCGGLGWALGNLCNRRAQPDSPFRLMLWMSVVPPLPMLALALAIEGPERIRASLTGLTSPTGLAALGGLLFTVLVATLVGSGLWTWLMVRHPSSVVAPFSMLVPVVGIGSSWLVLDESPAPAELLLGGLVVGGVLLGSVQGRRRTAPPAHEAPAGAGDPPVRDHGSGTTEPAEVSPPAR
ncbi:EamA family transporter [Cellulomonas shaoxiangyii]|uniref:EamA family transporter n=1 Tax=Cellulomonas shaoxiangyii TaxID=2566013 RepID=A0A4P7SNR4_9CELL|nr:EamA family transporter [Cellulomonas shaoxiangyii]QCB94594.1 EamA family transporter [Cellulomonas shaoxiangyii]TGY85000.1 EamA family transporter [Cellulomonas shaoxiangyii]